MRQCPEEKLSPGNSHMLDQRILIVYLVLEIYIECQRLHILRLFYFKSARLDVESLDQSFVLKCFRLLVTERVSRACCRMFATIMTIASPTRHGSAVRATLRFYVTCRHRLSGQGPVGGARGYDAKQSAEME